MEASAISGTVELLPVFGRAPGVVTGTCVVVGGRVVVGVTAKVLGVGGSVVVVAAGSAVVVVAPGAVVVAPGVVVVVVVVGAQPAGKVTTAVAVSAPSVYVKNNVD